MRTAAHYSLASAGAALLACTLATAVLAGSSRAPVGPMQVTGAELAAADFTHPRANSYFPLHPGLVTVLRGHDGAERFRERVTVTHRTRRIDGVRCRVVRDIVRRPGGSLAEKTHDFYAGDHRGRVWYFGENTATYRRDGTVESREGSWLAGRDGAVRGVVMPANPHPTQAYRQEFLRGEAEDQGWIVQNTAHVRTPAGRFRNVVRDYEWTRLEPRVVSLKFYARGLGIVAERDVAGGHEVFELVSWHR
jgi:hypothetical protein